MRKLKKGMDKSINRCLSFPPNFSLQSLIHVSTAYANSHLWTIGEEFYQYETKYTEVDKLVENLPEQKLDELTPKCV